MYKWVAQQNTLFLPFKVNINKWKGRNLALQIQDKLKRYVRKYNIAKRICQNYTNLCKILIKCIRNKIRQAPTCQPKKWLNYDTKQKFTGLGLQPCILCQSSPYRSCMDLGIFINLANFFFWDLSSWFPLIFTCYETMGSLLHTGRFLFRRW